MTGSLVALDTNHAIAVLAGDRGAIKAVEGFEQVCLLLGELRYGALNSSKAQANLSAIDGLVGQTSVLSADARTAEVYAEVRLDLKRRGRPIPENDVWIAALCLQHGAFLATSDSHFNEVAGLRLMASS